MKDSRKSFKKGLMLTVTALVLVLVGCSNGTNEDVSNQSSNTTSSQAVEVPVAVDKTEEDDQTYPITIKHAFGETIIESKPERVATIAWSNHDVALSLGIVPVGFSEANYGIQDESGMLPWTAEKVSELGVTEPNIFRDIAGLDFEAISDSEPDVILAAYSGITQEEYDTLSSIAPVVAYPEVPWVISWRDQVRMNAQGMGLAKEGEQVIKEAEEKIAFAASQYPELKGVKAAFAYMNPADLSSFFVYTLADPRGEFLGELGMAFPESLTPHIADEASFYITLSAENADALVDADVLVVYGNQALLEALQADPIYSKLPVVQNGSLVLIEDNSPLAASLTPSPLSIHYTTDEYVALIAEAVKKVK